MGILGIFLIMGNAGLISSTVLAQCPCLGFRAPPGCLQTPKAPSTNTCRLLGYLLFYITDPNHKTRTFEKG